MISNALFEISIKESIETLKKLKLYKDKGPKDIGDYSDEFKKICRRNKHVEIYNVIRDQLDYEIVLMDDSFFQFSIKKDYLRFSFIENPNFNHNKLDYLKICFPDEAIYNLSDEEINEMVDENEFEQFLNEQEVNSNLTYIRYDYDKNGYKPLLHSQSHLHIGLKENLRIPASIVLTPLQFVLFCIKQCYYEIWKIHHENSKDDEIIKTLHTVKKQCPKIADQKIWQNIETHEIYIT